MTAANTCLRVLGAWLGLGSVLLLAACSGGTGSGSVTGSAANSPPPPTSSGELRILAGSELKELEPDNDEVRSRLRQAKLDLKKSKRKDFRSDLMSRTVCPTAIGYVTLKIDDNCIQKPGNGRNDPISGRPTTDDSQQRLAAKRHRRR